MLDAMTAGWRLTLTVLDEERASVRRPSTSATRIVTLPALEGTRQRSANNRRLPDNSACAIPRHPRPRSCNTATVPLGAPVPTPVIETADRANAMVGNDTLTTTARASAKAPTGKPTRATTGSPTTNTAKRRRPQRAKRNTTRHSNPDRRLRSGRIRPRSLATVASLQAARPCRG